MSILRIADCRLGLVAAMALLMGVSVAQAATGWGVSPLFTLDTRTLAAPTGLSASKGTYYDKVALGWNSASRFGMFVGRSCFCFRPIAD